MKKLNMMHFSRIAMAVTLTAWNGMALAAKDTGPLNGSCDAHAKNTASWRKCVGPAAAKLSDAELFYAGYWLAKSGRYSEALDYLRLAKSPDARILTYIGFATRKQGDIDGALPYYAQALSMDDNYSVARAYLGEAYLAKGEPELAKAELAEIGRRCGSTCAEYADLAGHIAGYEAGRRL